MYLKSLQLRGFKSFADRTRLDFQPGITVVVGPNGSGKSNIVDALTWSLGTRSAKDLRGGQMADVIFAGARGRRALGRAAVRITIDNADGSLPIEFSEVTVGRAMFANGENTYSINDVDCRQLDVAELLSDTGLGRQTHTIISQGRIDAVLNARPEERRVFIEEAAGILKHRRRKDRALRKLAQLEDHLERLVDVLAEMRRQLRPLERQAEAARKHDELSAELRAVRTDLAFYDLMALLERQRDDVAGRVESDRRLTDLEAALNGERQVESQIADRLAELTPTVRIATETHFALANIVERAAGLVERIVERRHGLAEAAEEPIAGRPPSELRVEADRTAEDLQATTAKMHTTAEALAAARARTRLAEQARRAHLQAAAAEARRQAEARERQIRWEGQIATLQHTLAQAGAEEGRLDSQLQAQADREAELSDDIAALEVEIRRLDSRGSELTGSVAAARGRLAAAQEAAETALAAERRAERRRARLEARADALLASSDAGDGAQALINAAHQGRLAGIRGPLVDLMDVPTEHAAAVSAALGPLADALVVDSRAAAGSALGFVGDADAGRVMLLVAVSEAHDVTRDEHEGPPGLAAAAARPLATVVGANDGVGAALRLALSGTYLCDDLPAALTLAESHPRMVFVTAEGHMAGARGYAGPAGPGHDAVLTRAAAEEARAQADRVTEELAEARRAVGEAETAVADARAHLDQAQAEMFESDAQITAASERMARLGKELTRCHAEQKRLRRHHEQLGAQIAGNRERLAELERRGPHGEQTVSVAGEEAGGDASPSGDLAAEQLEDRLAAAREEEVQARLAASAVEQRADELRQRVDDLRDEADRMEAQLLERRRRQAARLSAISRCDRLEAVTHRALDTARSSHALAAKRRDECEEARAEEQRRLGVCRARMAELEAQLQALRDDRHREDLVRQDLTSRIEGVRSRLAELGVDNSDAEVIERGPDLLAGGDQRKVELTAAADALARKIGLLGTVNPLALEELASLRERHDFMAAQLQDLRSSKGDLLDVLRVVDTRIEAIFATAFDDVAAHFAHVFPMLFPGGSGRLVLTDPDDLLTTGVEVEARPPGKKVKRLSLLSGGERSLTALAVLFAIFAARPSPFYVLDEVDAALDDANLNRFLDTLTHFRGDSQWIVVTHQRRTMEIADTVYGVSMGADGVSKVVSHRFDDTDLLRDAS